MSWTLSPSSGLPFYSVSLQWAESAFMLGTIFNKLDLSQSVFLHSSPVPEDAAYPPRGG